MTPDEPAAHTIILGHMAPTQQHKTWKAVAYDGTQQVEM